MAKFMICSEEEANRRLLFVDNLKYIMRTKKIPASRLALKLGVYPYVINDYTRGKVLPDDERIAQIAEALGCTVDDLFDDSYVPWIFGPDGIRDKEKYKDLL